MHLTMSFVGDVESADEDRLREALASVHVPPFFLPVQGLGAFGGPRPSVIWAGVGKGHPHLFALHKHVQDAILRLALPADLRPFHPHITVGRAKDLTRATLAPLFRQHAETELGIWKVSGFTLYSSVLSSAGATHSVEMRREFTSA